MFILCWPLYWFWSDLLNSPIRLPRLTISWLIFDCCEFDITKLVCPPGPVPAMPPITTAAPTAESVSGSQQTRLGGPPVLSQSPLRLWVRHSANGQVVLVQHYQSIRYRWKFLTIWWIGKPKACCVNFLNWLEQFKLDKCPLWSASVSCATYHVIVLSLINFGRTCCSLHNSMHIPGIKL